MYTGKVVGKNGETVWGEINEQNALISGLNLEWAELYGDMSSAILVDVFTLTTIKGVKAIKGASKTNKVPQKAYDIADEIISKNGTPPKGYKGGRIFQNDASSGGQKLPDGVKYKEYDINPYIKGQNRGPERIVIGDDGSEIDSVRWFEFTYFRGR